MIKKSRSINLILLFLAILIISIFVTSHLQSYTPYLIDYSFITYKILTLNFFITPSAIVNAFTVSAAIFAIIQLFYTRKEIYKITETEALGSTEEVVIAMINILSENKIYELAFRAAIPAVGKTGASEGLFNTFKRKFEEVIETIKHNARLKYFDIKNKDLITKFYNKKGLTDKNIIKKLIEISELMDKTFRENKIKPDLIKKMKNLNPHFLIVNTNSGRKGVIWNIDNISKECKVKSAGFSTRNEEVLNTILKFYNEK